MAETSLSTAATIKHNLLSVLTVLVELLLTSSMQQVFVSSNKEKQAAVRGVAHFYWQIPLLATGADPQRKEMMIQSSQPHLAI